MVDIIYKSMCPEKDPEPSPEETADLVAKSFFGAGTDEASNKAAIRQLLLGAFACAVLIPLLFYFRFGEVGGLGWGTTIFFVFFCLLAAVGLYFRSRPEYHTPVRLRGDWLDRIGALWLVCCVFGPLFGWMLTSALPLTPTTWRILYGLRAFLAVGLPLLTALPLIRYLRGRATLVALPILVVVTLLPIWSAVNVSRDLWEGPVVRQVQPADLPELYLQHTDQSLGSVK
jgi:hypothetical protein